MSEIEIVYKKVDELKGYENNPRKNAKAVQPVANSIAEFGFKVPMVIEPDGTVVTGHTRLAAAQELGLEEVPCIIADDLTDEQVRAFRLADNKVSEFATWDFGKLEEELLRMEEVEFDLSKFGFDELDKIDINEFFSPDEEKKPAEHHESEEKNEIVCPHCGEVIFL